MSLNIKNQETCRLAEELAELTGETKTRAITVALRERLERERHEREELTRELLEIGRNAAQFFRGSGLTSTNIGDFLYDEDGLPR
ncbi:MAG: type II toxin-antitoxin system VapB family antitoxin [Chloroflexi bacterium]|nr:type II toxin-antitoxin system VapB family antitoxin [Chloroflexota bacterium]